MNYRLYLLDKARKIRAAEAFVAADDARAVGVAMAVYASCSDAFDGYEIWSYSRKIADDRSACAPQYWWAVTQSSQKDVLDLEDRLQRSFSCVSKSQRLLESTKKLRSSLHHA